MDYTTKKHSKYLIMAHLIFVTKYRKKLLNEYSDSIKLILYNIAKEEKF
jgi:REP element-mobilizing transposase RayT